MESAQGRVRPSGWWFDGLLVAAFAGLTAALAAGALLGLDRAVRDWCDTDRPAPLSRLAGAGNLLGQGGLLSGLCLAIGLFLAWRRRSVRPVLPVLLAFVLTTGTLTPLKYLTDRAAPHSFSLAYPERFGSGGVSYPSGHLVNSIVWYGVLALLLSPWLAGAWRRVVRVAPPAILCVTTVYLGYHWLTDTVAGVLLGLFLDRLMGRVRWNRLAWPRRRATRSQRSADQGGDRAAQLG